MSDANDLSLACPRCRCQMRSGVIKTAMWYDERLYVVEDVPARICDNCMEQYYDEETTDALRRLTEDGFPFAEATGEILVPLFSLKGRVPCATSQTEDATAS